MTPLEGLRNKIFWFLDSLKGGNKRTHYDAIRIHFENPNAPENKAKREHDLQNILNHAISTVPFYNEINKTSVLQDFPVVNKNCIRDQFDDFLSSEYIDKPTTSVSTSGSTGTPFKILQDNRKKLRNTADNIFFSELAGFKVGYRLTYFRLWNAFEKKGVLERLLQNIRPIDVFDLGKDGAITKEIEILKQSKATNSWLGYASAYEEICKYLDQNNVDKILGKLHSAIAISERLNPYTKQAVRKYFDVDVVSRYSNVENGIIAQQPLGDNAYFLINEASYIVEILDINSDKAVKDGESGRIVVTDLFNYATPMIRYDTGDIGIKTTINSRSVLSRVEGRKIDVIYNTKGEIVPINLVLIVNKYHELKQSQLIQKAKGVYHLKLNCDQEFLKEKEFLNAFKVYLGEDAKITIEYVNEIPLLASGKRRVMVNEMINS
ncbi:CoF synthetase [Aquimarina sp. D1M17]|uniref:CoF synthetase n=1 Tax=Aquimarina acroporae TaxID=2937283 RepID=UPI0020BED6F2|nr:CoF synthetase [Aquimarina acroporae]MCK8520567.1 CoF synthetase [Aquimarina acroporae]